MATESIAGPARGRLGRFADFLREVRNEIRKVTWPTWDELKGSTVVVMISILILGVFTFGVDVVLALFVRWMTQI